MKKLIALFLVPVLSGCISATTPTVSRWLIEFEGFRKPLVPTARYGTARVSQITVAAPYDSVGLTVLRADGTVAFDPYNEFAAQPSRLLKGVLFEAASRSGLFASVVGASSATATGVSLEAVVSRLALDCRTKDGRRAVATVLIRIVDRRDVTVASSGTGESEMADGNYGKALSEAVSRAIEDAFGKIR